jgi:uncharacterized protein YkwD
MRNLRKNLQKKLKKQLSKISISALPDFAQEPTRQVLDTVVPTVRNNFRPHALRHRSLALISFLLISVKIATIAVLTFGPVLPALSSAITSSSVVSLTNQSRSANNLSALTVNGKLAAAAQAKANDMMAKQYFSHVSPDNKQPWDFISAQGYSYQGAGENLGVGFFQAEGLEDAWMNSPGHRANILNSSFKEIGIGIASGVFQGQQATVVVQMFGSPLAQLSAPVTPKVNPAEPKPAPKIIPKLAPPVPAPAPVAAAPKPASTPAPASQPVKAATNETAPANPAPAAAPTPAPAAPLPPAPTIPAADLQINKDKIQVTVETSSAADKVTALFGNQFEELKPNPNSHTLWQGQVPVSALTEGKFLNVKTEKAGTAPHEERLAVFDSGFKGNYDLNADPQPKLISILGFTLNPELLQNQFYLLMIALLLSLMVVAIAVRTKVQHLDLISNTAFVVTLATLLWYSGIHF